MTLYDLGKVVGDKGDDGDDGKGITSITKTGSSGLVDTYTITYSDGTTSTFTVNNGADGTDGTDGADGQDGADGVGISSITKTSTSGKVDTYTITYTDSTTSTFTVTNGSDASVTIQTAWGGTLSDTKVPSEKLTKDTIDTKVDKVTGKGLSEEDYTSTEKTKLSGIETGANNYTHPSSKQCNYAPDLSNYVPKSDIVDNLTSTATNKPLSANQGKVLMDLIGDAIQYINE